MTSLKQLEANRRNALKSTGPKTKNGKYASRRSALKHGFTAETVIEPLENPEEYRAFEATIVAEYPPQTPVEQELVPRLASLLWRLRRATAIETGLLRMQGEILRAFRSSRQKTVESRGEGTHGPFVEADREVGQEIIADPDCAHELGPERTYAGPVNPSHDVAISYLRLANLDNELIDRLSRYEASLWRQVVQTLFTLQTLKRR
jgi:hypothetical protein